MKLFGTGILAAFMAASVDKEMAYSCALAAGVNTVASVHYALIWMVRAQVVPSVYMPFVSKVGSDDKDDGMRLAAQELAVDGLRSSDWAVNRPVNRARAPHHW